MQFNWCLCDENFKIPVILVTGHKLCQFKCLVFDVFPSDINLSDTLLKSSDDRTQIYHKFIEASKFAFALRSYVGDVDTAEVQEVSVDLACFYKPLKAVDTIGNCQRLPFTVVVS